MEPDFMWHARILSHAFCVAFLVATCCMAQEHRHAAAGREKLGTVDFRTSCGPAAQSQFNRAVALLHSFQFGHAIEAFQSAINADPSCAISYWGIALSDWGNPFATGIKQRSQMESGLDAVGRARSIGPRTGRERAYIEAVARLYTDFDKTSQRSRLLAYQEAMSKVTSDYPDDTEATIFYALALAASADPADKTYANQLKAGAMLEKLFAQQPDHPGLAHYIIHSYDFPPLAPHAVEAARRYSQIAPSAPHALHMPSHTFTRVGYWQDSIDANVAAVAAARREGQTAEELHATDYMTYAYLQTAQDRAARRLVDSLPETLARFDPAVVISGAASPATGYFASAAIPARFALERRAWAEAARLVPQQTPFPYTEAITYFARGLGAAHMGDTATARSASDSLRQIHNQLAQGGEAYWALQAEIQRREVSAWLALAEKRPDEALAEMHAAAEMEDGTEKSAVTPGPIAPARELLGEMLLDLRQPGLALTEFEATLTKEPNRFRALYGAAQAAKRAGNSASAQSYARQLLKLCERGDKPGRAELAETLAILP